MNSTENRIMTLDELRASAAYWQKLLRLQDWDVEIKLVRGEHFFDRTGHTSAMCGEGNLAQSYILEQHKRAVIKILDPVDWNMVFMAQDHEHDLVHELIHLLTNAAEPDVKDKPLRDRIESAINLLAGALVEQRRELWKLQNAATP